MKRQASSTVECPHRFIAPLPSFPCSHRSLCLHCPGPREDRTDRRRGFPQRLEIHGPARLEGLCSRVCWDDALCVSGLRRCGVRRISPTRSWCALEAISVSSNASSFLSVFPALTHIIDILQAMLNSPKWLRSLSRMALLLSHWCRPRSSLGNSFAQPIANELFDPPQIVSVIFVERGFVEEFLEEFILCDHMCSEK